MRIRLTLLSLCLAWCAAPALAMTVETQGNKVYATGPVEDDVRKFEEAFANAGVDTVVFVNSPGGDLWTGLRVGRMIADKGYKTVIAGNCISACSIMYMGGKERRFSDAFRPAQTLIGIHGAHNKDTKQIDPSMQPQIFAFYKQHMGDKFNSAVMNQALYDMGDSGALLRVFDPVRSVKTEPYHCKSGLSLRNQCTTLPGADALNLGIITHADLVKLDLPVAFKVAPTVLGKPLDTLLADSEAYYADLANRQCPDERCKTSVKRLPTLPVHWAVATPVQGLGRGVTSNLDTPLQAMLRAIYNCNHLANQPVRLCEPEVVSQYDVRPIYLAAKVSHREALAALTVPNEKFYANEEYGGGFTSASGLRTGMVSGITPQKLDGITTVGTQELVRSMLSAKPPVVIDVAGAFETIPGSVALLSAGSALDNAAQDEALEKRISALLLLIAPDTTAPIVFFCTGRNCWMSVNAALRAKKIGYTHVQWYRGGIESWKAASLPIANGMIRAVAQ